jgi:L-fuconolactonase
VPVSQAWLDQHIEEALEPELPICDPHHHLWDYPHSRYLLDELLQDTGGGHNIRQTVFVECMAMYRQDGPEIMRPVGETEFVQGIAAQSASGQFGPCRAAAGIVSFADLMLGEGVIPVLQAHRAASQNRFRGVRHACSWDASDDIRNSHTRPPEHLYLQAKFREGFACLEEQGLVFDSWIYHTQLHELASLAREFPGVTIVLDHMGGPLGIGPYADKRAEVFKLRQQCICELAACDKVAVKLGGLAMPINGFDWHKRSVPPSSEELAEVTAPYYLFCIEQFGVQRCMFESNFPVDKVSCSYTVLWNSFKRMVEDFSPQEKAALFHDTAVKVYSLEAE